jgi:superfamily II DNA helicase RecQ
MSKRTSSDILKKYGKAPKADHAEVGLHRFFPEHRGFKPGQEKVIRGALLKGESAAAIFPTGGGKSLCYQLPGLMLSSKGLTLVVSPLLALMKDQVDSMRKRGHPVDLLKGLV